MIRLLAKSGKSKPQAADALDRAVEQILKRLRKGHNVELPGLGELVPGEDGHRCAKLK